MSKLDDFTSAIRDNPTDNDLRAVFADWLEDQGDIRAGCIRLAARLRPFLGPRQPDHSPGFWKKLVDGIEPTWWAEEALRLVDRVADEVGDGRKTAVLIWLALCESTLLFPSCWSSESPKLLRVALDNLEDSPVIPIERLHSPEVFLRVLRTATLGDDELAQQMLEVFELVGKEGMIRVERGTSSPRIRRIAQRGQRFPLTSTDDHYLDEAAVVVSYRPLRGDEVQQLLEMFSRAAPGLLLLAPGLDDEGAKLIRNAIERGVQVALCTDTTGRWRDCYDDIASSTGATAIDDQASLGLHGAGLGRAEGVRLDAEELAIERPNLSGRYTERIELLRQLQEETTGEEQEWHSQRLAQLAGAIITIEVLGETPEETEQLFGLACSTMHSGRAAGSTGYLPGGGVAYLHHATAFDESLRPAIQWAFEEPARTHLEESGIDLEEALAGLRGDTYLVYDSMTSDPLFWQMDGPIDPVRVVRTVIERAVDSLIHSAETFSWFGKE